MAQAPNPEGIPLWQEQYVFAKTAPSAIPETLYNRLGATFPPETAYSCVAYVKWLYGARMQSWGDARDMQPNSQEPSDYGIVLTSEGGGHVAFYERRGDMLHLYESNYVRGKVSQRDLPIASSVIRGYR